MDLVLGPTSLHFCLLSAMHSHIRPSDFRLCHSVIKTFNVHEDLDL